MRSKSTLEHVLEEEFNRCAEGNAMFWHKYATTAYSSFNAFNKQYHILRINTLQTHK